MREGDLKVGAIIENSRRQFAKVIVAKNSVYGLSAWSARTAAEQATVAQHYINVYGLTSGVYKLATAAPKKANAPAEKGEPTKGNALSKKALEAMSAPDVKALAEQHGIKYSNKKDAIESLLAL